MVRVKFCVPFVCDVRQLVDLDAPLKIQVQVPAVLPRYMV